MKRFFAFLFALLLVFALSVPCFADNWGDISVDVSSTFNGATISNTMTSGDFSALVDIAIKSERIGLFGGGTVVGLLVYWNGYSNREHTYQVYAFVCGPNEPYGATGVKREQFQGYVTSDGLFRVRSYYSSGSINQQQSFNMYELLKDGSWRLTANSEGVVSRNQQQLKTSINNAYGYSLITTRDFDGNFVVFDGYKPLISDGNITVGVQTIIDNYNLALLGSGAPIPQEDGNYFLDIPSLITSIPAAASAILTGAFDFELFGINIAGFLSVLLVITIVGWVIWFLIKR